MHLARRMLFREVERGEVMEVVFDVRAFGHFEAHVGEDGDHFVHDLERRVDAALGARRGRQGQVDALLFQALGQVSGFEVRLAGVQHGLHGIAHRIDGRARGLALLRRQGAERLEQAGDAAGLAQRGDADGVERGQVVGGFDFGFDISLKFGIDGHDRVQM